MATITVSMLREKGACEEQVELFKELFGKSVKVTEELCIRYSDQFYFDWAARVFLSAAALAEYKRVKAAAWAEYKRVKAAVRAEYLRVAAPAWAEYDRVAAPALAEYKRVKAPAWAEYLRVKAAVRAEYLRVKAQAWARCYNADTLSAKGGSGGE